MTSWRMRNVNNLRDVTLLGLLQLSGSESHSNFVLAIITMLEKHQISVYCTTQNRTLKKNIRKAQLRSDD